MSAPPPITEKVPADSLDRPASTGLPTSRFIHADVDGGGTGPLEGPFTVTFENVAIAVREVSLLTTARPT